MQRLLAALALALGVACAVCGAEPLVRPGWDYFETPSFRPRNRAACVNASANHSRWVHYALPAGKPPLGGWPIYLVFPPWAVSPASTVSTKQETCGDRPALKPVSSCIGYLKQHCTLSNSSSYKACMQCASWRAAVDRSTYTAAGCHAPQAVSLGCKYSDRIPHGTAWPSRRSRAAPHTFHRCTARSSEHEAPPTALQIGPSI